MWGYLKIMRLISVGPGVDHFCGSAEIFNLAHKMEVTQKKRNAFEYHIPANDIGSCYFFIAQFKRQQTEK